MTNNWNTVFGDGGGYGSEPIHGTVTGRVANSNDSFVGNLAENALFPPNLPTVMEGSGVALTSSYTVVQSGYPSMTGYNAEGDSSQFFSIQGIRNTARIYSALRSVFGTWRVTPDLCADPYKLQFGDVEELYVMFDFGYGRVELSDLKIGNTPISSYKDIDYKIWYDYTNQRPDFYRNDHATDTMDIELSNQWITRSVPAQESSSIFVRIHYPMGSIVEDKSGGWWPNTMRLYCEWRVDGGAWKPISSTRLTTSHPLQSVSGSEYTFRIKRQNPFTFWMRLETFQTGQLDIRIRRKSYPAYHNNVNVPYNIFDQTRLTEIGCVSFRPPLDLKYPHTVVEFRIFASDQIGSMLDDFNAIAKRFIPVWDGTQWLFEHSRNPAWIAVEILRGDANPNPIPDHRIDLAKFKEFADWCDELTAQGDTRFTCDANMDAMSTVHERLISVLSSARASVTMRGGKYSVIWERWPTVPAQVFTPMNSWGFTGSRIWTRPVDGLKVKWIDPEIGYQESENIVYSDDKDETNSQFFETISCPFATRWEQAYRDGRYHLAVGILRPEVFTIITDIESLVCERGDLVRVQHDVPRVGGTPSRIVEVQHGSIYGPDLITGGVVVDEDYWIRENVDIGGGVATFNVGGGTLTQAGILTPGEFYIQRYENLTTGEFIDEVFQADSADYSLTLDGVDIDNIEILPTPQYIQNHSFEDPVDPSWTDRPGAVNTYENGNLRISTTEYAGVLQWVGPIEVGEVYRGIYEVVESVNGTARVYFVHVNDWNRDVGVHDFTARSSSGGPSIQCATNLQVGEVVYGSMILTLAHSVVGNGEFSDIYEWTFDPEWSVNRDTKKAICTGGAASQVSQPDAVEVGKFYRCRLKVSAYTSGSIASKIGDAVGPAHTGTGWFTDIIEATTSTDAGFIGTNFVGEVDHFIVDPVTKSTDGRWINANDIAINGGFEGILDPAWFTGSNGILAAAAGQIFIDRNGGDGFDGARQNFATEIGKEYEVALILIDSGAADETSIEIDDVEIMKGNFSGLPILFYFTATKELTELKILPTAAIDNTAIFNGVVIREAISVIKDGEALVKTREPFFVDTSAQWQILIRFDDGTSDYFNIVEQIDGYTVALEVDPVKAKPGDLTIFGKEGFVTDDFLVKSIVPGEELTAVLTLVPYSPEIQDADTGEIPAYDPPIPEEDYTPGCLEVVSVEPVMEYVNRQPISTVYIQWDFAPYASYFEVWISLDGGVNYDNAGQTQYTRFVLWEDRPTFGQNYPTDPVYIKVLPVSYYGTKPAIEDCEPVIFEPPRDESIPGKPLFFAGNVTGVTMHLTWLPPPAEDIAGYVIRYSPLLEGVSWDLAATEVELVPYNIHAVEVNARVGTYLIKTVDTSGHFSIEPALVKTTIPSLEGMNVILDLEQSPDFLGTKDLAELDGNNYLIPSQVDPGGDCASEPMGIYYFAESIELNEVQKVYLSAKFDIEGAFCPGRDPANPGADYDLNVQVRISTSAPIFIASWPTMAEIDPIGEGFTGGDWSGWQRLTAGYYTGRKFQFRALLTSADGSAWPVVKQLSVQLDVRDRIVSGSNIPIQAGGQVVLFDDAGGAVFFTGVANPPSVRSFSDPPAVTATLDNATLGDFLTITDVTAEGFTAVIRDGSNNPIAGQIDYMAKGYGYGLGEALPAMDVEQEDDIREFPEAIVRPTNFQIEDKDYVPTFSRRFGY